MPRTSGRGGLGISLPTHLLSTHPHSSSSQSLGFFPLEHKGQQVKQLWLNKQEHSFILASSKASLGITCGKESLVIAV